LPNIRCHQVDAFTDRRFAGNPAAVCLLGPVETGTDAEAETAWMQAVAAEMNLSETAFVRPATRLPPGQPGREFELRWFTPAVEVDLCGHATLASAHVLWTEEMVPADEPIRFHTRSGILTAARRGGLIELDFPAMPPTETPIPEGLAESLGLTPGYVARNGCNDVLAVLESERAVRGCRPDFAVMRRIPARGVILTAPSDDPQYQFVSRFFAPALGIDEDPVCGSAHCGLGPYWAARLGRSEVTGHQVSARGGIVRVRLAGDRAFLGGQAITVLKGELV
jgi:PhzF family phenazine biosynthesis protein